MVLKKQTWSCFSKYHLQSTIILARTALTLTHLYWVYTELPKYLGLTYDQKMVKLAVTRELIGKVFCSSYVTHQKVISYSWILTITRAYLPLKSISSTTVFNLQNGRGTCQFYLRVTQIAAGSSFGRKSLQVGRNSFDGLACHSARS